MIVSAQLYRLVASYLAVLTAFAVVFGVGYFESVGLLVFQILIIAGPVVVPFWLLSSVHRYRALATILVGAILAFGWGYVIYIDTRPYMGGGASLAVLFGWAASALATVVAAVIRVSTAGA